jgi:hypothetical protein
MKEFCEQAIAKLEVANDWGELFCNLRMDFHRKHGHNLIQSTWHGADFFNNVLIELNGGDVEEPKGEYQKNFKKLIDLGKK